MKRGRAAVVGLLGCAMTLAGAARAEDAAVSPVELAGSLQNAQQAIAQGDAEAYAAMPKLLRDISAAFAAAKPEVWQNPRNAHAAVIYLLSGGETSVVTHLLEGGAIQKDDQDLMKGALAYVMGREAEARQLLGPLDAKSLDLSLGGQVAFVQSILLTSSDTKKAVELLDLARLLTPGGLVEEAALRREIVVVGDMTKETDKFLALGAEYANRFPRSPYSANFLKTFTASLLRLRLADDIANFSKLAFLAEGLRPDQRREFFLTIARAALVNGKIAMADLAASKALKLAAAASADEARGKLYQSAARTLTEQYDSGLAQLLTIDARRLPPRDAALLAAARSVAKQVRLATPAPPTAAPGPTDDSASATIRLAEAALAKAQNLQSAETP